MFFLNSRFWGFIGEMIKSNYRRPSAPYRLVLYLTRRCNCRCRICNIWKLPPEPELSTEEIKLLLKTAARHIRWLHLSGGEIFLRDDIDEILRAVAKMPRLFIFQFATNATYPDRVIHAAQIMSASKIPRVIITLSIDGVGDEHDKQRGVPGLFNRVITAYQGIKESSSPRVKPYLGLTLTKNNIDGLPDFIRELNDIYNIPFQDLHFNFYHRSEIYYQNDAALVPTQSQAEKAIKILKDSASFLSPERFWEDRYRSLYPLFLRTKRSPMICEALSGSLSIGSDGRCYPCMGYNQPLGSIDEYDYDLRYLWRSESINNIRSEITAGRCPHCWTPCEAFHTMFTHMLPGHKL